MKALSVRQPWASLIVWGMKSIEIRTWTSRYRGRLWIHASKTIDRRAMRRFQFDRLPTGCLIGTVELVSIEPFTPATWRELADEHLDMGSFVPRLFGWRLENPEALEAPVDCRGNRGLFEVPDQVAVGF